jgi:hypothetical protein
LKLEKSIGNLAKKLDRLDPEYSSHYKTGSSHWKGKPIIPLNKWIKLDTFHALNYFPDDFDQVLTYIPENEVPEKGKEREEIKKWNSDFIELMEHTRNPNYGKMKCIHCLLSPRRDDPIFTGIDRLFAKRLTDGEQGPVQYPCEVVNKFQCPYERDNNIKRAANSTFDAEDLFKLEKMAFAVEISLAIAEREDSRIRIRDKEELFNALTDKDMLTKILEQASEAEASEDISTYLAENRDNILDYFIKLKDKVDIEELRFY